MGAEIDGLLGFIGAPASKILKNGLKDFEDWVVGCLAAGPNIHWEQGLTHAIRQTGEVFGVEATTHVRSGHMLAKESVPT